MHIVNRKVDGIFICNGEQGTVIDFVKVHKLITLNMSEMVKENPQETCEDAEGAIENIPITKEEPVVGEEENDGGEWEEVPVVRFLNGWTLKVGYHEWMSEEIDGVGIRQIPLILAWAVSIHKCQGTTLGIAEVDIGSSVFECAQSYVALSRVKTLGGLYLKSFDPRKIRADPRAVEYYRQLGETRVRVLAEREHRAREQPVAAAVLEPRNPTLSRYFVSNQPIAPIPPDTENAKRGGSGGFLEEEDDYIEVATEVADYMKSDSNVAKNSDVKVINFSQYAYRG